MYKAIVQFTDLQDHGYKYLPGNVYPRKGLTVSAERIKELSTSANKRHRPMIVLVEDEDDPKEKKPQGKPQKAAVAPKEEVIEEEPFDGMNPPVIEEEKPVEKEEAVEEKPVKASKSKKTEKPEEPVKPKRGRKKIADA